MSCRFILLACLVAAEFGCESKEVKQCQTLYADAQGVVTAVQASSVDSVSQGLKSVEAALPVCQKAGRQTEFDQLVSARNQLRAQLNLLEKRAGRKAREQETPEQIAMLEQQGDPDCPKGQAYKHRKTGKEIRCIGPQPIEMTRKQAKDYYSARNFSLHSEDAPPTLKAEYGSELYIFEYPDTRESSLPKCLKFYPPPGMSPDEAVSRATGVSPQKLKDQTTVKVTQGELAIKVENTQNKLIVFVGQCS